MTRRRLLALSTGLAFAAYAASAPDAGHRHCWHQTGTVIGQCPPRIERCCFCGTTRATPDVSCIKGEHGPYGPSVGGDS